MFFRVLAYLLIPAFLHACGVKGKPLPPETPREIGIGKPQYKGIDKELRADDEESEEKVKK